MKTQDPHNGVFLFVKRASLLVMCVPTRRDNWDIAMGIGTKFQRFSHKNSM